MIYSLMKRLSESVLRTSRFGMAGLSLHTIAAAIGLPVHNKQSLARVSNALRTLGHPVERHRVQVGDVMKITRLAFSPAHKVA